MTPGLFEAIFAGITLLILWSGTVLGAGIWIMNLIRRTKEEILRDFNAKHLDNAQTVRALNELVIRHDVLLNQEFGIPLNGERSYMRGTPKG